MIALRYFNQYLCHCQLRIIESNNRIVAVLSDEVLTAQTFIFLLAGSESISSTLSFAMYHIAKNPVIQSQLTKEIDTAVAKHGVWTYQAVKDMTFLDQIVQGYLLYGILDLTTHIELTKISLHLHSKLC